MNSKSITNSSNIEESCYMLVNDDFIIDKGKLKKKLIDKIIIISQHIICKKQ